MDNTGLWIRIVLSRYFHTFCSPSIARDHAKNYLPDVFVLKEPSASSLSLECSLSAHTHLKFLPIICKDKWYPWTPVWGPPPTPLLLAICQPLMQSLMGLYSRKELRDGTCNIKTLSVSQIALVEGIALKSHQYPAHAAVPDVPSY